MHHGNIVHWATLITAGAPWRILTHISPGEISNITLTLVHWFLHLLVLLKEEWDLQPRITPRQTEGKLWCGRAKDVTAEPVTGYVSGLWPLQDVTCSFSVNSAVYYCSNCLNKRKKWMEMASACCRILYILYSEVQKWIKFQPMNFVSDHILHISHIPCSLLFLTTPRKKLEKALLKHIRSCKNWWENVDMGKGLAREHAV